MKLYLKLRMKLKCVHQILDFDQLVTPSSLVMYVKFKTTCHKQTRTDFEKDFYKLTANVVNCKTMENVQNQVLAACEKCAKHLITKPTLQKF